MPSPNSTSINPHSATAALQFTTVSGREQIAMHGHHSAAAPSLPNKHNQQHQEEEEETFSVINDNADLLEEVLGRLDGRSLAVAGCVCRVWAAVSRRESVWEAVCGWHVAGDSGAGARPVVAALGGYRRLYRFCVGPALERLRSRTAGGWAAGLSLSLSLSLFAIEYYERRIERECGGGSGHPSPASLLFLGNSSNPVDVS
ncbi:F-box protein SNE-like [Canna indica]|uniref:F-box protein SNE-like n=1 Tax=Canna indica TaxID=4628 RepID=A0AAQ3PYS8_9LILI|nr:F-box protein SNE-like [Canna indica]